MITKGQLLRSATITIALSSVFGCAPSFEGTYSDPAKAEIVDDKWNETDARKTAQSIVNSVLTRPWLKEYQRRTGKRPVVIVDDIGNRTDEHIDTRALAEFIQDELINSGKVRYLNNKKRQELLEEIKYQNSGTTSGNTRKSAGKQIGADFLFGGEISSTVHSQGGLKTVTYQTAMNLTNIESSEIAWSGKELIKKRFKRSGSKW